MSKGIAEVMRGGPLTRFDNQGRPVNLSEDAAVLALNPWAIMLYACLTSGLLESLDLSGETERVLRLSACNLKSIPAFADAGWELHQRLSNLQVPLPPAPLLAHPSTPPKPMEQYLLHGRICIPFF